MRLDSGFAQLLNWLAQGFWRGEAVRELSVIQTKNLLNQQLTGGMHEQVGTYRSHC